MSAMSGVNVTDLAKILKKEYSRIFWLNLKKNKNKFWESG